MQFDAALVKRMDTIEGRLETIEGMLQRLLTMQTSKSQKHVAPATDVNSEPSDAGEDPRLSDNGEDEERNERTSQIEDEDDGGDDDGDEGLAEPGGDAHSHAEVSALSSFLLAV